MMSYVIEKTRESIDISITNNMCTLSIVKLLDLRVLSGNLN